MRRINVVGSSGAGKTTVAAALAARLEVPHLELDSVHHLADWRPIDTDDFRRLVREFTDGDGWVVDGNYSKVRDIVWSRADTVVFLDYPRHRVMRQLIPRTLRRVVRREELWNGNREKWTNLVSTNPERNLLVWSWTRHGLQRDRFAAAVADQRWEHITFLRCNSPTDTAALLDEASPGA